MGRRGVEKSSSHESPNLASQSPPNVRSPKQPSPLSIQSYSDEAQTLSPLSPPRSSRAQRSIQIILPRLKKPGEYVRHCERVNEIVRKDRRRNAFVVRTTDGLELTLSKDIIKLTSEGLNALEEFGASSSSESDDEVFRSATSKLFSRRIIRKGDPGSDNGPLERPSRPSRPTQISSRQNAVDKYFQLGSSDVEETSGSTESSDNDVIRRTRNRARNRRIQTKPVRSTRVSQKPRVNYEIEALFSDTDDQSRRDLKRKRTFPTPTRRSERANRLHAASMRERGEDEIDEVEEKTSAPKVVGAKESFRRLPEDSSFRKRHCITCDTCGDMGNSRERGDLIFCQSCTMSYHANCLGHRTNREHLVTKVGEGDFVLQCRRCVEFVRLKDRTAPRQGQCAICAVPGPSSKPFRARKSPAQEQKDRELNDGSDPIQQVSSELLNNPANILFRCHICLQGFHLHHLEPKQENPLEGDSDVQKALSRFSEYSQSWICHVCESRPTPSIPRSPKAGIGALIAWRPTQSADYESGQTVDEVPEDDKEYLVKWSNMSHYNCRWMPGSWVWGITSPSMRKAFAGRDNHRNLPTMRTEDAIPEDWLRIDIIFSVKYNNLVQAQIEEVDLARIKEVARVHAKFKGLGYEDSVWTDPPDIEETERFEDFRIAYRDYIKGKYIRPPTQKRISERLHKLRSENEDDRKKIFNSRLILKKDTSDLLSGDLMDYQLEGVNWLIYQWQSERNAILADEMGLGKTIQVIGFLAALKEKQGLWPFLVVVPNATCANWRREINQWAPHLRVVTYFGSERSKTLTMNHLLFGDRETAPSRSPTDLRCHVVITSYEAASDPSCQPFLKRISWQALVVDEGQRLKNDKTVLYTNLRNLKAPFRLLMTGTPMQNNQRELFNLLQFLDKQHVAADLEAQYIDLNQDLIKELHAMIRPYFLRRTKTEVLGFLPPMGQVIVPVTMTSIQRELYKNVLGRNASLLKAIMSKRESNEKSNSISGLRNILMQLRKCLCHPFVYSIEVEERTENAAVSHRRLVAASPKLKLLELILPKLRAGGHRVLFFSQFLGMLTIMEDFLDGMELPYLRLDGSHSSLIKQRSIDAFNDPESNIFAMLLSTRAGGVGINLATADTVIILDPDFNPHQDIQAISRAHRIGQKNKVLVLKLMTRDSAEEKIMQAGKRKMVLDHVIVDQMDVEDTDGNELESILAYGAQALFNDEAKDIVYDDASVETLLDRSQIKKTEPSGNEESDHESGFSFARIWQNDAGRLEHMAIDANGDIADTQIWDQILAARAREAKEEQKRKQEAMGRGKRNRAVINYGMDSVQQKDAANDSDTDFADRKSGDESSDDEEEQPSDNIAAEAISLQEESKPSDSQPLPRSKFVAPPPYNNVMSSQVAQNPILSSPGSLRIPSRSKAVPPARTFSRVEVRAPAPLPYDSYRVPCMACLDTWGPHEVGYCPLKKAGPEYCNLCGMAHFGYARTCPHLKSETQVKLMLEALKNSPEDPDLVRMAKQRLQGLKGTLVQAKKRKLEAASQQMHLQHPVVTQTAQTPPSAMSFYDDYPPRQNDLHLPPPSSIFQPGWTPVQYQQTPAQYRQTGTQHRWSQHGQNTMQHGQTMMQHGQITMPQNSYVLKPQSSANDRSAN